MSDQAGGGDELVAVYDDDDRTWRFAPREPGPVYAPVAVKLGGLRWEVDAAAPERPLSVSVDLPAPPFAVAAVGALVGPEAEALLAGPGSGDPVVPLAPAAADRRAALGRLAVATLLRPNAGGFRPARALDTVVLLHRAGLDALSEPLPGHDELADEALELLDALPEVVRSALAGPAPEAGSPRLAVQRGLVDLMAFVRRSEEALLADVDVDEAFAALLGQVAVDLEVASLEHDLVLGVPIDAAELLEAELVGAAPRYRARGAGIAPEVLVGTTAIRGILATASEVLPDGRIRVEVTLRSGRPPSDVHARVISPARDQVVASARFEPSADRLQVLEATIDVAERAYGVVEVVLDVGQPVVSLVSARRADANARIVEAYRQLQQRGALSGDGTGTGRTAREDSAAAAQVLLTGAIASMTGIGLDRVPSIDSLLPPTVEPFPSDGLSLVLHEVADELVEQVSALASPAVRAAEAQNAALLVADVDAPWLDRLVGRLRMVEVAARRTLGPEHHDGALVAAQLAADAFGRAGDDARRSEATGQVAQLEAGQA